MDRKAPLQGRNHSGAVRQRLLDVVVMAAVAAFSFAVVMVVGLRGFFAFDQSICFDGGYRVLLGQVPFKDFVAPMGPVVFWIQAAFFRLFHVNYAAYVAHAATANAIGSVLAVVLIRQMYPEKKIVSYVAGVLTGAWFYAPFGTPWFEQTAFLFGLAGYLALVIAASDEAKGKRAIVLAFSSGAMGMLAFLSKQNAGALLILAHLAFVLLAPRVKERRKLLAGYAIGAVGASLAFGAWLFLASSPDLFLRHFFELPLRAGESRVSSAKWVSLLIREMFHRDAVAVSSGIAIIASGAHLWYHKKDGSTGSLWAAVTVIILALFQPLFASVSRNQLEVAYPFAGVIAPLAFCIVEGWAGKGASHNREARASLVLGFAFVSMVILGYGLDISFSREAQDIFHETRFVERLETPEMSGLRWGEPTRIRGTDVRAEDFDRLMALLKSEGKEFFIFPDFTIAYGIVGEEPPQPILWFHKGLTYPEEHSENLDRWIVSELKRHSVKIVVIERVSFMGTGSRLRDFELLSSYIENDFAKRESIGIFDVYYLLR